MTPLRIVRAALLGAGMVGLTGCATTIRYAEELSTGANGRTALVTAPAAVGGFAGLVIGVGANLVLLPVTGSVYLYRDATSGPPPDVLSTLFFPTFVLWQAGKLLAAPFDTVDYLFWRSWRGPESLSPAEREEIERAYDKELLQRYLVRRIYPADDWNRDAVSRALDAQPIGREFLLRTLHPDRDGESCEPVESGAPGGEADSGAAREAADAR